MMDDKALVNRLLNVFNDTPEIASWFDQDGEFYDYEMAETQTHLLGMWETMKEAAHRIEAQADAVTQASADERAKIVAWLRDDFWLTAIAADIEAGEHLK
jgi:hypothetical protein